MYMLINGEKRESRSGERVPVTNPATGAIIDTVPAATKEDVEEAIAAAVKGQKEWAEYSVYQRGEILRKFSNKMMKKKTREELALLLSKETGKLYAEAYEEIGKVAILLEGFIEKSRHLYGSIIPPGSEVNQERTLQMVMREPLGVIACIVPFNFPVGLFGQKVPPALVSGNAAIVKPATDTPLTTLQICNLIQEARVPKGVIQVLTGSGARIGDALVASPDIALISLTGSTEVGIHIAERAAKNLTRCTLELGGNDAFILMEDGDLDLAVKETIQARMRNAGQICCASKRFFVQRNAVEPFIRKLIAKIQALPMGDPLDPKTKMGSLINEKAAKAVESQVNETVAQGAKIRLGGKRRGAFYESTILSDVKGTMEIARDMEVFGPVIPIIAFDTLEEAVAMANHSIFGLSSAIITRDMQNASYAAQHLDAGSVVINGGSDFRALETPFGGHKLSGIGNEGIMCTLEEFSQIKTVVLKNIV